MQNNTFSADDLFIELDLVQTPADVEKLRGAVESLNLPALTARFEEALATVTASPSVWALEDAGDDAFEDNELECSVAAANELASGEGEGAASRSATTTSAGSAAAAAGGVASEGEAEASGAAPTLAGGSVAAVSRSVEEKNELRAKLQALIAGTVDIDTLTTTVAQAVDTATRSGDLFVIRAEMKEAVKAKAKALGVKLTAAMLAAMFPAPKKTSLKGCGGTDFTEAGVTERMLRKHGDMLMYTPDTERWFMFDGGVWKPEASALRVTQLAREVIASLPAEAAKTFLDPELYDEAMKDIKGMQRYAVAVGATKALAGELSIAVESIELDTHPDMLTVANGVVDLRTGELLPADPKLRLTMSTGCSYNPDAKCPVFVETLTDAMRGNKEHVDFLQRLFGYAMMANPVERILAIPLGGGKNGKSTIFNAIQETLGAHAGAMTSDTIATPHNAPVPAAGGPREDLLNLRGKRMVFASEIKRSTTFVDHTVKTLAGGSDPLTARGLHKSYVTFKPTCVVFAPTNVLPLVREDDPAVWDRLVLLPFYARFDLDAGVTPDLQRPAKLAAEKEGILAWLVQGALEYQRTGLAIPESITALKKTSQDGASPIALFLEDCCVIDPHAMESTDKLFSAWKLNALEQGEKFTASTKIAFGRTLKSHGFEDTRVRVNGVPTRCFKGLRLKDGKGIKPEQTALGV